MANYTQNYQLHQWDPQDPFLRTDFNQDLQKIDTALGGLANQSAALEAAVALCGNCSIEVASYAGDGTMSVIIHFAKKPLYFLIAANNAFLMADVQNDVSVAVYKDPVIHGAAISPVETTWQGLGVTITLWDATMSDFNSTGTKYQVLSLFPAE